MSDFLINPFALAIQYGSFGTKYTDPSNALPGGISFDTAWHPSKTAVIVTFGGAPRAYAYAWSNGFGSAYSDPVTSIQGVYGYGVEWSPDGNTIIIITDKGNLNAYAWSSGFGTKYTSVVTDNTGTHIRWSPDGNTVLAGSEAGPVSLKRLSAWVWNNGFGTRYASPSVNPGDTADIRWHPNGANIVSTHVTGTNVNVYAWSGGFGSLYSLPTISANKISGTWNPTGNNIVLYGTTATTLEAYAWSSGFGTKYADPSIAATAAALATQTIGEVDWSPNGLNIALSSTGANPAVLEAYPWNNGFGTKHTSPTTGFNGGGEIAWAPDSKDLTTLNWTAIGGMSAYSWV